MGDENQILFELRGNVSDLTDKLKQALDGFSTFQAGMEKTLNGLASAVKKQTDAITKSLGSLSRQTRELASGKDIDTKGYENKLKELQALQKINKTLPVELKIPASSIDNFDQARKHLRDTLNEMLQDADQITKQISAKTANILENNPKYTQGSGRLQAVKIYADQIKEIRTRQLEAEQLVAEAEKQIEKEETAERERQLVAQKIVAEAEAQIQKELEAEELEHQRKLEAALKEEGRLRKEAQTAAITDERKLNSEREKLAEIELRARERYSVSFKPADLSIAEEAVNAQKILTSTAIEEERKRLEAVIRINRLTVQEDKQTTAERIALRSKVNTLLSRAEKVGDTTNVGHLQTILATIDSSSRGVLESTRETVSAISLEIDQQRKLNEQEKQYLSQLKDAINLHDRYKRLASVTDTRGNTPIQVPDLNTLIASSQREKLILEETYKTEADKVHIIEKQNALVLEGVRFERERNQAIKDTYNVYDQLARSGITIDKEERDLLVERIQLEQVSFENLRKRIQEKQVEATITSKNNSTDEALGVTRLKNEYKDLRNQIISDAEALKILKAEEKGAFATFNARLSVALNRNKEFANNLHEIGGKLNQIGQQVGIFGTVLVGALTGAISSTDALIERFRRLSEETGLSYTRTQQLVGAFRDYGVKEDEITRGLKILAQALEGVDQGNDSQIKKFRALGISLAELQATGNDASKLLELIADKAQHAGDRMLFTGQVSSLLGRNVSALLPALAQGGKAFEDTLKNQSVLSEAQAESLSKLATQVEGAKFQFELLVADFVNSGKGAFESITNDVKELFGWFRNLSEGTKKLVIETGAVVGVMAVVGGAISTVLGAITGLVGSLTTLIGSFGATAAAASGTTAAAGATTAAFGPLGVAILSLVAIGGYLYKTLYDENKAFEDQEKQLTKTTHALQEYSKAKHEGLNTKADPVELAKGKTPEQISEEIDGANARIIDIQTRGNSALKKLQDERALIFFNHRNDLLLGEKDNARLQQIDKQIKNINDNPLPGDDKKLLADTLAERQRLYAAYQAAQTDQNKKEIQQHKDATQALIVDFDKAIKGNRDALQAELDLAKAGFEAKRDAYGAVHKADAQFTDDSATQLKLRIQNQQKADEELLKSAVPAKAVDKPLKELRDKYQHLYNELDEIAVKNTQTTLEKLHKIVVNDVASSEDNVLDKIKQFQADSEAQIAKLPQGDKRIIAEENLQKQVLDLLKIYHRHQQEEEKNNIDSIVQRRKEALEKLSNANLDQLNQSREARNQSGAQAELDFDKQIADGKLSIYEADQKRYELRQKLHEAEIADTKAEADEIAHTAEAKIAVDQEAATKYKALLDAKETLIRNYLNGTQKLTVDDYEKARARAIELRTKLAEATGDIDKQRDIAEKARVSGQSKVQSIGNTKDTETLQNDKRIADEKEKTLKDLDAFEKKLQDDALSRAYDNIQQETDQFQKLSNDRIAILKNELETNKISQEQYTAEVKRLAQDEADFRKHVTEEAREANLSEFNKLYDFLDKEGLVTKEELQNLSTSLKSTLENLLAQSDGAAINTKEFEGLASAYEKTQKKLEDLNNSVKGNKDGLNSFFNSFDLGAVNRIDGTGKISNVLSGISSLGGSSNPLSSLVAPYADKTKQDLNKLLKGATSGIGTDQLPDASATISRSLNAATTSVNNFAAALDKIHRGIDSASNPQLGPNSVASNRGNSNVNTGTTQSAHEAGHQSGPQTVNQFHLQGDEKAMHKAVAQWWELGNLKGSAAAAAGIHGRNDYYDKNRGSDG